MRREWYDSHLRDGLPIFVAEDDGGRVIGWSSLSRFHGRYGYRFTADSSLLPKDARTIYIESFVNRSRDVGLEKELATAMRSEFYRRGPLRVVDQPDLADVIVSGVIRPLENTVASVNGYDEVLQYLAAMTVDTVVATRHIS